MLSAGLLLTLGLLLGLHWGSAAGTPAAGSVEAGFALDMQAHHLQAVEMATLVLDRTDDGDVRVVARDIQLTQQQQAGQMYGWLETWGLGQGRTEPVMAWMAGGGAAHGEHDLALPAGGLGAVADMPGMATPAQLQALTDAEGVEAERVFCQLMATHHAAGVEMARAAAAETDDPQVRRLAEAMVNGQTAELVVLGDLLDERGGPVAGL